MWIHHVSWVPAYDNAWKLNFAGFVLHNDGGDGDGIGSSSGSGSGGGGDGTSGMGCVLRDHYARFKAAYAAPLVDCGDILTAELSALYQGLHVALHHGVDHIEIEGDVATLIVMLAHQEPLPLISTRDQLMVVECLKTINSFRSVRVRRIDERSNDGANILAKMATGLQKPSYWDDKPPKEIETVLVTDVIGRWISIP